MNDIKVEDAGDNLAVWEKVRTVPPQYLKPIQGGRLKGKSDISPIWRMKTLTELFGPVGFGWYYEITEKWTQVTDDGQKSAHVQILLYVKSAGEWSKGIAGLGGSMLMEKEKAGFYHSDEAYKMALTDAISVSCKALGLAADVYSGMADGKYQRPAPAPAVQYGPPSAALEKDLEVISQAADLDALRAAFSDAYRRNQGNPDSLAILEMQKDKRKRVLTVATLFDGQEVKP